MSTRPQLSETINRLLPGEQYKRIREAILAAASYSGSRTDQLRQSIDLANRLRTGLLINGTTTILTDTSAEAKDYVWVINFAVQQPSGVTSLPIDAPEASFVREDYFLGLADSTIIYRPGTVDALGNSFPPVYDPTTEVVLRIVRRNPDGTNEDVEVPEGSTLIDFAEQNIIPYVSGGKLKNSGIQVIFDALGELAGFRFPSQVKGLPAVNDDEFVTKSQLPVITQYGRISGGVIQWASGLTYNFSRAILAITGECIAESGQVTLNPADPTDPRFDGLGWEKIAEGIADRIKLSGTPNPTPAFPQFDPETQVEGIFVLVPAAATEPPGITTENVYLENTEWAVSFAGIGTGNADSTADPKDGTKAIETSAIRNAFKIILDRGSVLDLNTLTDPTIGWDQKLKSTLGNNQNFDIIFLDGSGAPASNLLQVAINKSSLAYQFIGINLDAFTFTTKLVRYIEIRYRQNGSGTFLGTFLDNIKIQGGVSQPPNTGGSGEKGWSPILAVVTDGERRVLQVVDWTGGEGTKPATGQYIGATGLTSTIGSAVDIRGAVGADGADGAPGADGVDGAPGVDGADGAPGEDGREVELQVNGSDMLQWRYVGDPTWIDLFDFSGLGGGGGGHVIKSNGTAMTHRAGLNFSNRFNVTDDSSNDETDVDIDTTIIATRAYVDGGANSTNAASRLYLFNNY